MILQVGSSILKYEMGDEGGSTVNVTDASRKIFLTLAVKPSDLQDQLEYSFQRYFNCRYHGFIFILLFVYSNWIVL